MREERSGNDVARLDLGDEIRPVIGQLCLESVGAAVLHVAGVATCVVKALDGAGYRRPADDMSRGVVQE